VNREAGFGPGTFAKPFGLQQTSTASRSWGNSALPFGSRFTI